MAIKLTLFGMTLAIAIAIAALTTLTAQRVSTQSATIPRAEAVKRLAEAYGEVPVALGIASFGLVVEVFATADGATWTIIATTPDRMSRVIAAGRDWTPMLPTTAAAFKKVRAVAAGLGGRIAGETGAALFQVEDVSP